MTTTTITSTPLNLKNESSNPFELAQDEDNETNLFTQQLDTLREAMQQAYMVDENGNEQTLSDEQLDSINQIIDRVVEVSTACFEPFFNHLQAQLSEQLHQIEQLEELLTRPQTASACSSASTSSSATKTVVAIPSVPAAAPVSVAGKVSVPTLGWVAQNRKSGKTGDLTGFNIFTMAYSATFKAGRAPAGVWKEYDQKPWKALATAFNTQYSTGKATKKGASTVVVAEAPSAIVIQSQSTSVPAPISAGAVEKPIKDGLTAYMYWSMEYHKTHGHRPSKGEWAKVPKKEVEDLKAKLANLKAARA